MNHSQETVNYNFEPKKFQNASMAASTVLSAIFAIIGCFLPVVSIVFFALSAGYMASGMCASKKFLPLLAIIPSIIIALVTKSHYLSIIILLAIPLCAITMYFCALKGAKKTLTVIITSVALGLVVAIVVLLAVSSVYGSVSSQAWQQLSDELQTTWNEYMNKVLDMMREHYELSFEQYSALGMDMDKEQYQKTMNETLDYYTTLFLYEYPTMIKNLIPSIVIIFLNVLSYIAVSILYKLLAKANQFYSVELKPENAKLTIEGIGMAIFVVSYIISMFTGSHQTFAGSIFTNLYLIYTPAMTVIGIRMLFWEGGIKNNLFYIIMIGICLFLNPPLVLPLTGFFAAANTMNSKLAKYLEDANKNDR